MSSKNIDFIEEKEVTEVIRTPCCITHYSNNAIDIEEKYLIPHFKSPIPSGVRMSKESIYSSSFLDDAEKTSLLIKKVLPNAKTITDATANVGCNTISFAKHFSSVTAVEIDPVEFQRLEGNLRAYNINNVKTVNEDYTYFFEGTFQDVVFIDAPWGGTKYNMIEKLVICLSKIRIEDIANYILNKHKATLVVLKTPGNVYFSGLKYPYKKVDFYRNMCPFYTLWFVSNRKLPDIDSKVIFKKIEF
jgi:16S rRNA G966 N2-methylase RsmD